MTFSIFSSSTAIIVSIVVAILAILYRAALPKPIPGIPYNYASSRSIFGDIPSMMKWKRDTRETFTWMTEQCNKLNAPMVQIFVKPFSAPWVIVVDARECQDVLTRRSKEFDRSSFTTDVVQPILREHHFPFPSGPKQRAHRALLSDLMTPAFLNEVCVLSSTRALVKSSHFHRLRRLSFTVQPWNCCSSGAGKWFLLTTTHSPRKKTLPMQLWIQSGLLPLAPKRALPGLNWIFLPGVLRSNLPTIPISQFPSPRRPRQTTLCPLGP
jgi:hypothetical protein